MRQNMSTVEHIHENEVLEWTKMTTCTFDGKIKKCGKWKLESTPQEHFQNIDRKRNSMTKKTTTTDHEANTGNINKTFLFMRNY
jgi:hypothetical protein